MKILSPDFLLYMDQTEQILFSRAHSHLCALVWSSGYLCLIHCLYQSIFQYKIWTPKPNIIPERKEVWELNKQKTWLVLFWKTITNACEFLFYSTTIFTTLFYIVLGYTSVSGILFCRRVELEAFLCLTDMTSCDDSKTLFQHWQANFTLCLQLIFVAHFQLSCSLRHHIFILYCLGSI